MFWLFEKASSMVGFSNFGLYGNQYAFYSAIITADSNEFRHNYYQKNGDGRNIIITEDLS
jgi:hypothetical protein